MDIYLFINGTNKIISYNSSSKYSNPFEIKQYTGSDEGKIRVIEGYSPGTFAFEVDNFNRFLNLNKNGEKVSMEYYDQNKNSNIFYVDYTNAKAIYNKRNDNNLIPKDQKLIIKTIDEVALSSEIKSRFTN